MKLARTPIVCALLFAMLWSSLAGAVMTCQNAEQTAGTEMTAASGHANQANNTHHHDSDRAPAAHDSTAHQHGAQDEGQTAVECPCCEDCVEDCAMSGCNPVPLSTNVLAFLFNGESPKLPLADVYRVGPSYPSLFRPPIANA